MAGILRKQKSIFLMTKVDECVRESYKKNHVRFSVSIILNLKNKND